MQNIINVLYIIACFAGVWLANRLPVKIPQPYQVGGFVYQPNLKPFQALTALFALTGAGIGWALPSSLAFILAIEPSGGNVALNRIAGLIGAVCGGYIGARAVSVWTILMLAGFSLCILKWILGF